MPIGYENPNGDRSKVRAVRSLSREEAAQIKRVKKLQETYRLGKKAEEELSKIVVGCSHRVFNDEESFIYNIRTCVLCGSNIGLI